MTLEAQQALAQSARELWMGLLPDMQAPQFSTFLLWATFDSEILTRAINRTAAKFRRMQRVGTPMTDLDCAKYCSSVCRNMGTELRNPRSLREDLQERGNCVR
jgi:hypothetical protein